jgi:hypothetical protein
MAVGLRAGCRERVEEVDLERRVVVVRSAGSIPADEYRVLVRGTRWPFGPSWGAVRAKSKCGADLWARPTVVRRTAGIAVRRSNLIRGGASA